MGRSKKPDAELPTLTAEVKITKQSIAELLVSAFESSHGSRSWVKEWDVHEPTEIVMHLDGETPWMYDFVLEPQGAISMTYLDEKDKERVFVLNLEAIQRGLNAFPKESPVQFGNFISGNYDAITSDCFLQCCVFGEVIYS